MSLAFTKTNSDTLDKLRAKLPRSQLNENNSELYARFDFCFLKSCVTHVRSRHASNVTQEKEKKGEKVSGKPSNRCPLKSLRLNRSGHLKH